MQLRNLLSTVLIAAISNLSVAAEKLVINIDEQNAPFMYAKDDNVEGIYPAVIAAAFRHMNVVLTIRAKPWKRCIYEIDTGTAGIGGIYKNTEREQKYDFSAPIFVEKLVVYFNATKPLSFTKIDDLKDRDIGVRMGWSYGDDFDAARKANVFTTQEVGTDEQNFWKLEAGRIDAAIAIAESGIRYMPKCKNVVAATTPLSQIQSFLAFSKTNNRTSLLRQFDQAIADMKKSGEFQTILNEEVSKW